MYDALTVRDKAERADAIFVLAGRPERKAYGLALWNAGRASVLVLSVGRFEWRGIPDLPLPDGDGGLRALVDQTPPTRRHFFLVLDADGCRAEWIRPGRFGTRREARAFAALAAQRRWRSVVAITTAGHTRRTKQCLRRASRGDLTVAMEPVPESLSAIRREDWWRDRRGRRFVIREWIKTAVYWFLP